ncbi:hypothetical protein MOF23_22645 [Bacillus inaquosorum]|uniref:hypothetical protein n=1 Tax=Bacillus inaquosorum TaxID=483913 RepID=UPI00227DE22C|nr:hypothetical protein [Bacillus inaquosorum]MCY9311735.1 hypothetical protein [Bacillus inaquosorum]
MINQTNNNIDVALNLSKIVSKETPYEVIPRDLLQAPEEKEMSLQALGLLLHLKSLPDTWTIIKTNLYHRFPFNKESSIRKAWSELEQCNYAKEVKKRDGKKYKHYYFFDIVPFDTNSIELPTTSGKIASFLGNQNTTREESAENNMVRYNNRFEDSYELLPRELLQTKELSLEAMALLCYLISYPTETFEFRKTKLYNSFKKNKRKAVVRMLDELIEKRYFLQFKKREGKKDIYKYIYRHSSFSDDEIIELKKILSNHHFVMLGDTQESNLGTGKRTSQEKTAENLGTGKRTSQETPSNQGLLDCSFSGVQNQVSIFECSNSSSNRIHMEDNTHIDNTHIDNTQSLDSFSLDDDDEKNIYIESETDLREIENQAKEFKELCLDERLRACAIFLESYSIKFSDIYGVIKGIKQHNISFTKKTLEQQLKRTLDEQRENGMTNFVKYFLIGLKRNSEFIEAQKKRDKSNMSNEEYRKRMLTESFLEQALGEIKENPLSAKVPFYNWLEE